MTISFGWTGGGGRGGVFFFCVWERGGGLWTVLSRLKKIRFF